ncbi:MAG: hypothetical protein WCT42_00730 [Candidatus Paceibacterota bacterium]
MIDSVGKTGIDSGITSGSTTTGGGVIVTIGSGIVTGVGVTLLLLKPFTACSN